MKLSIATIASLALSLSVWSLSVVAGSSVHSSQAAFSQDSEAGVSIVGFDLEDTFQRIQQRHHDTMHNRAHRGLTHTIPPTRLHPRAAITVPITWACSKSWRTRFSAQTSAGRVAISPLQSLLPAIPISKTATQSRIAVLQGARTAVATAWVSANVPLVARKRSVIFVHLAVPAFSAGERLECQ